MRFTMEIAYSARSIADAVRYSVFEADDPNAVVECRICRSDSITTYRIFASKWAEVADALARRAVFYSPNCGTPMKASRWATPKRRRASLGMEKPK